MKRRVFLTGIGMAAPTGIGHHRFWQALVAGVSPIAPITRFDASSYACQIGGQVEDALVDALVDERKLRTTSHVSRLALVAADDALRDARLANGAYADEALGVTCGTALGGWIDGEQQYGILLERGARRINPFLASGACNHAPGAEVATAIGAHGAQYTFSSGCPSSLQAIGQAARLIAEGSLDACIAGGTESPLSPMVMAALTRTKELSTANDTPATACRPFDVAHGGMVLSEGSCFLLLEDEESARQRGATPYAEVITSASSCDANGLYGFDEGGTTGGRTVHRLLATAAMAPTDLDYVCAHANGSPAFDRKETQVLRQGLGEAAARIPVSSIKGVLGHPFGASGAFQVAAAALAMRHRLIPPTANLASPDAGCELQHVLSAQASPVRTALVTSYGYGGINAFLLLTQPR